MVSDIIPIPRFTNKKILWFYKFNIMGYYDFINDFMFVIIPPPIDQEVYYGLEWVDTLR